MTKNNEYNDTAPDIKKAAMTKKQSKARAYLSTILPYVIGALIAIVLLSAVRNLTGFMFVDGDSMNPTYYDGDMLLGKNDPKASDIKRGDVVTFMYDNKLLIKRVVGVPGDVISYQNGTIYVNGEAEKNDLPESLDGGILDDGKILLPKNKYFCMGDNRNNSYDSRYFGSVDISQMREKITATVYHKNSKAIND